MMVEGPDLPPGTVVRQRPGGGVQWRFDGRRLEGVRFERIKDAPDWLSFRDCDFVDCEFVDCRLDWYLGSPLPDPGAASRFKRCVFTRCDLRNVYVRRARFEDCTFDSCRWNAHFFAVDLLRNRFVGTVDSLSLWGREDKPGAPRNVIIGNDFSQADLLGMGLSAEVPVDDQLWPRDEHHVRVERVPDRMRALRTRLEQDGSDPELLRWLEFYWVDLEPANVQSTKVVRLDDPLMDDTWRRAWRALVAVELGGEGDGRP